MKKILLSFCLMLASMLAWANPVSYQTAVKVAENFATSQGISIDANPVVNLTPEGMFRQLYVFGFDGAKGFVIIAADDRVTPILGYSLEDDFSSTDMPTNVYECFNDYSDQIDSLVADNVEPTEQVIQAWNSITATEPSAVHALLSDCFSAIYKLRQGSGNTSHHINVHNSVFLAINPRVGSGNTYTQIIAVPDDPMHGSVSGSGYYRPGTTATLKAIPNKGYRFSHWDDDKATNPRYVSVNSYTKTYTAIFIKRVVPPPLIDFTEDSSLAPLCFTARNGSVRVFFLIENVTHQIQYSTNGTTWYNYTSGNSYVLSANQSIYFRAATSQTIATAFVGSRFIFRSTNGGTVEASGNIMSLYGPDCPDLPLAPYAFSNMFAGCTSLTKAPSLPATTLALGCYEGMFYYCTSLKTIPYLPATTLASWCYNGMFKDCTSLVVNTSGSGETWKIPATSTASRALEDMFSGTSGTMNGTPSVNTTYYLGSDCHVMRAKENDSTTGSDTDAGTPDYEETDIISATSSAEAFININRLFVDNLTEGTHVTIIGVDGKTLYSIDADNRHMEFDLPTRGVYMVVLSGKQEQILKLVY